MQIAEWTIWSLAAFSTLQWSLAFRRRAGEGKSLFVAAATIPLLWVICLIVVPVFGHSLFHLLWLFPLGLVIAMLPPFFPLNLLGYLGQFYGRICCIGLHVPQELIEQEARELVEELLRSLEEQCGLGLRGMGRVHRGRKRRIRTLDKDDLDSLRKLLVIKGIKWQDWECKLHNGNIIIYSPAPPLDAKANKHGHPKRRMVKHLRVVPEAGGPFRLQHLLHKRRWCPIDGSVGDLETIADFIADDRFGPCNSQDPVDAEQLRLRYHPPAAG